MSFAQEMDTATVSAGPDHCCKLCGMPHGDGKPHGCGAESLPKKNIKLKTCVNLLLTTPHCSRR